MKLRVRSPQSDRPLARPMGRRSVVRQPRNHDEAALVIYLLVIGVLFVIVSR